MESYSSYPVSIQGMIAMELPPTTLKLHFWMCLNSSAPSPRSRGAPPRVPPPAQAVLQLDEHLVHVGAALRAGEADGGVAVGAVAAVEDREVVPHEDLAKEH